MEDEECISSSYVDGGLSDQNKLLHTPYSRANCRIPTGGSLYRFEVGKIGLHIGEARLGKPHLQPNLKTCCISCRYMLTGL